MDFPKANITVRGRESDGRSRSFYSTWAKLVGFVLVPMSDGRGGNLEGGNLAPMKAPNDVGFVKRAFTGKGRTKCSSVGMAGLRDGTLSPGLVVYWTVQETMSKPGAESKQQ